MTSAFGVEHQLAKSAAAEVGKTLAEAHKAGEHAAKAVTACPKCGPGTQRAHMSMRAWESQSAAARRNK